MENLIQFKVYLYGNKVQLLSSGQAATAFLCAVKVLHHCNPAPSLSIEKEKQNKQQPQNLPATRQNRFSVTKMNKYGTLWSKCVICKQLKLIYMSPLKILKCCLALISVEPSYQHICASDRTREDFLKAIMSYNPFHNLIRILKLVISSILNIPVGSLIL